MGTTDSFLKLRSSGTPKMGEWNINYSKALELAKKNGKYIIACWSNGDNCGYCVQAEKCMMDKVFTDWQKKQDVYFVFQYSGDKDGGKAVKDLIYCKGSKVQYYPGFRITLYNSKGAMLNDASMDGNTLRNKKTGTNGAKAMVENLTKILSQKPSGSGTTPSADDYKIRLNEKLTVKKVNSILDAIDKNGGYCPCQASKTSATKCHCKDFRENKKIGEPCICNIYVKQEK